MFKPLWNPRKFQAEVKVLKEGQKEDSPGNTTLCSILKHMFYSSIFIFLIRCREEIGFLYHWLNLDTDFSSWNPRFSWMACSLTGNIFATCCSIYGYNKVRFRTDIKCCTCRHYIGDFRMGFLDFFVLHNMLVFFNKGFKSSRKGGISIYGYNKVRFRLDIKCCTCRHYTYVLAQFFNKSEIS